MKFLIVLAAVALASADVSHLKNDQYEAGIVRQAYDISPEGNFQYVYETANGIQQQAEGVVKNPNSEAATLEVKGNYGYTSPEGEKVELSYIANEDGYQVQGSHVPVPPEIPEYIARSLAYIAAHPPRVDGRTVV